MPRGSSPSAIRRRDLNISVGEPDRNRPCITSTTRYDDIRDPARPDDPAARMMTRTTRLLCERPAGHDAGDEPEQHRSGDVQW